MKGPNEFPFVLYLKYSSHFNRLQSEHFRQLVEKRKRVYLTARFKREKRLIASSIVSEIRAMDPPGRFLARKGGKEGSGFQQHYGQNLGASCGAL